MLDTTVHKEINKTWVILQETERKVWWGMLCGFVIPQLYYKIKTAGHTKRDKTNPLMNIGPYKKDTKTQ